MEHNTDIVEKTFVAIKPDGIYRSIVGKIISRFEDVGLKIVAMKMIKANKETIQNHYAEHINKPYYKTIEEYMLEGPLIAMVIQGDSSIKLVRKMVGNTEPHSASLGTIRGDFAHGSKAYCNAKGTAIKNLIHASSNKEDANREIKIWFNDNEISNHVLAHEK